MRSFLRGLAGVLATGTIIFFCSCDKHQVGELPEVQKEHVDLANEKAPAVESTASPGAETTPTPAEFFPESSPR